MKVLRMPLVATCLALAAMAGQAQEVTLKVHHFLGPQSTQHTAMFGAWCDKLAKESANKLKCQIYPSMQLGGSPPQLYDQAKDGVADIIWTVAGYSAGRFPKIEVFELPFMMTNAEATSRAAWEYYDKYDRDEFKDTHILAVHVHGPGNIYTTNKPIKTMADFKGLKLRAPTRLTNKMLAMMGATPVGMPVPAVAEGLSKGVIDGTTIPWEVTPALKVPELVHNHTEFEGTALYTLTFVLAMNKAKYDSLPDDLKAVIDANSGLDFSIFAGGTQADADGPARQIAVDLGNNIITVSEAETGEWRELVQPIYDSWVADMNGRGIDGQALIDEARALMAEYKG